MTRENEKKFTLPSWAKWFLLFMAVILFWHILMREYSGDAVTYFGDLLESTSLWEMLRFRYYRWTSRVILEAAEILLSSHFHLFEILNFLVYGFFLYNLLKLTRFKHTKVLVGLWLIYPIAEMSSAGWISTFIVYLWPLSFGTYALSSLDKIYRGEKIRPWEWITFSLCTLIASNQEQMAILILCILAGVSIDCFLIKKSRSGIVFVILQALLSIANLILMLVSPGNTNRKWAEQAWLPDFSDFGIFDMGALGVVDTMDTLIKGSLLFLILVGAIFLLSMIRIRQKKGIWSNVKRMVIGACATVPFLFTLTQTVLAPFTEAYLPEYFELFEEVVRVDAGNWNRFQAYIPFFAYMLIILGILVALLNLFDDTRESLIVSAVFFAGLITRVLMGTSPTIYASGMRTFLFFDAMIIFAIWQLYAYGQDLLKEISPKALKAGSCLFTVLIVMSVINNTIAICGTW